MESQKVSIELSLGEWNAVLSVLANGPFVTVAPLIETIRSQAQSQISKPSEE